MTPVSKVKTRRRVWRGEAKELLGKIIEDEVEVYLAYRRLYALWCSNNAAVRELRPLFRIDGVDPDGRLSVTDEFRTQGKRFGERDPAAIFRMTVRTLGGPPKP